MACSQAANPDVVCTASSIPTFTLRQVLTLEPTVTGNSKDSAPSPTFFWRVPVFQRRYCWGEKQLQKLLQDILSLCPSPRSPHISRVHQLGRLVVTSAAVRNEFILIDGQQRLSTVCIFISSLRDYLAEVLVGSADEEEARKAQLQACDDLLLPNGQSVLHPTYFDRQSFYSCVDVTFRDKIGFAGALPATIPGEEDFVMQTRRFFDNAFRNGTIASKLGYSRRDISNSISAASALQLCSNLLCTILDKVSMLFFLVRETDVQSVYERLAMREALIATGTYNGAPGVSMSECDLARNLVTSFGCGEASQLELYSAHWAPVERAASAASVGSKLKLSEILNQFLSAFISYMASKEGVIAEEKIEGGVAAVRTNVTAWFDPGLELFPMYKSLKRCINTALLREGLPLVMPEPTPEAERVVVGIFTEMNSFGETYWPDMKTKRSLYESPCGTVGNIQEVSSVVCPCYARGTLCTDCIVKKFAKK